MKKLIIAKRWLLLWLAALFCLAGILIALFFFRRGLESDLQAANCSAMNNVLEQQKFTFSSKLKDQKDNIKIYADFFEDAADTNTERLLAKLSMVTSNSNVDFLSYATPDGEVLENTGNRLNVSDRDYFKKSLLGETVIEGPLISKVTNSKIVIFSSPIYNGKDVCAVLIGVYSGESLSDLLMSSFDKEGYTYVTTGEGQIIFKTETNSTLDLYSNLFEAMDTTDYQEFTSSNAIRDNVGSKESGHSRYSHDDKIKLMHYAPIGTNDWYMFLAAPEEAINPKAIDTMYNTTLFIFIILVLIMGVFIYMFLSQRTHMLELRKLAFVDTLTGAANKKKFKLTATELLDESTQQYVFAILDIDKFKVLNDTLGYICGDSLLINITKILKKHLGNNEFFCRCDSDEFFLLLHYTDDILIHDRLQILMNLIENEFKTQINNSYSLVLCAGIYVIANTKESIDSIGDKARHAHKLIKGRDESGISFYNEDIRHQILEEKEIENKMHGALRDEGFLLYLQPKYYLDNEKIYGAEALVRWIGEDGLMIYPNEFIPIFEKNGFVTKLDMYMLEKSCQTIRRWLDSGITPIPISINFSRLHLKNLHFVDEIAAIVEKYDIPPQLIEVELTESTMLNNEDVLIAMLSHLHEHGFILSMDDFGSGYSSLGLLKNLPVDVIKLDRTFFVDYSELKRAITVVGSIISMAKNLGIKTVAEGVETLEQIDFLKELGCDIVQGYYFERPMPAAELNRLLGE